ncbi:NADH-quinone oxidoreductase subunit A [Haloferacaceae archaeon DSL9]
MSWIAIGALALVGIAIPLGMMAVSALLRPSVPEQGKSATYESGEIPTGPGRAQVNIQYYMVALLFVVFDIETVLIFPWAVIYSDALAQGVPLSQILAPMLAFIAILTIGLVWAWRNGAVEWMTSPRATARKTERQDA